MARRRTRARRSVKSRGRGRVRKKRKSAFSGSKTTTFQLTRTYLLYPNKYGVLQTVFPTGNLQLKGPGQVRPTDAQIAADRITMNINQAEKLGLSTNEIKALGTSADEAAIAYNAKWAQNILVTTNALQGFDFSAMGADTVAVGVGVAFPANWPANFPYPGAAWSGKINDGQGVRDHQGFANSTKGGSLGLAGAAYPWPAMNTNLTGAAYLALLAQSHVADYTELDGHSVVFEPVYSQTSNLVSFSTQFLMSQDRYPNLRKEAMRQLYQKAETLMEESLGPSGTAGGVVAIPDSEARTWGKQISTIAQVFNLYKVKKHEIRLMPICTKVDHATAPVESTYQTAGVDISGVQNRATSNANGVTDAVIGRIAHSVPLKNYGTQSFSKLHTPSDNKMGSITRTFYPSKNSLSDNRWMQLGALSSNFAGAQQSATAGQGTVGSPYHVPQYEFNTSSGMSLIAGGVSTSTDDVSNTVGYVGNTFGFFKLYCSDLDPGVPVYRVVERMQIAVGSKSNFRLMDAPETPANFINVTEHNVSETGTHNVVSGAGEGIGLGMHDL